MWKPAWFRGPIDTFAGLLPAEIDAVLPTPAADVMLALTAKLAE